MWALFTVKRNTSQNWDPLGLFESLNKISSEMVIPPAIKGV